jgi:hypothetical protein
MTKSVQYNIDNFNTCINCLSSPRRKNFSEFRNLFRRGRGIYLEQGIGNLKVNIHKKF